MERTLPPPVAAKKMAAQDKPPAVDYRPGALVAAVAAILLAAAVSSPVERVWIYLCEKFGATVVGGAWQTLRPTGCV
jgi:hypothetical protein